MKNEELTPKLSVEEAKRILSIAIIRRHNGKAEILYNNRWLLLCITDLENDVSTTGCQEHLKTLDELRQEYFQKIIYGACTTRGRFAVIDSVTDG